MADGVLLPVMQFLDADGDPISGGKVHFYEAGTSTPKDTYQEESLVTPHANPVVLDSAGMAEIWLDGLYKMNVLTSADVQVPGYPIDDISWAPAVTSDTAITEWVSPADVPTYISATSFTVPDDKRTTYQVGRRIKATVTAGTVYCLITAVSFAASVTTVTVSGGSLDSGLSVVDVGILSATNPSIPKITLEVKDATSSIHAVSAQQINKKSLTHDTDETASKAVSEDFSADTGWTKDAGWTISGGKANAAAGSASDLTHDTLGLDINSAIYRLTYTISSWTAGELTPKIGSSAATTRAIVSNQTFTEDIIAPSSGQPFGVVFSKDASFDGSIDDVSVEPISDVFTGTLAPAITIHTAGMEVSLLVNNSNGGTAPTLDMGGGADTIKRPGGHALEIEDIKAGEIHKFISDSTDWILQNPYEPEIGIMADARNLVIIPNSGTPLTQIDIDADAIILEALNGKIKKVTSVDLTIDATTQGANGLGVKASLDNNSWYYIYVISDGTTLAGLLDTSSTAPILPSGYHYKALLGAVKTDGSAQIIGFEQRGKDFISTSVINIADGSLTTNTWTAVDVSLIFPPIAKKIIATWGGSTGDAGLSHRSDGQGGHYSRAADAGGTEDYGILTTARANHDTKEIWFDGTNIYYWVANAASTLDAIGGSY